MRHLLIVQGLLLASVASEYWEPKTLGTFQLKDAGFLEVFETHPELDSYADRYTLYLTTFNFAALFIHDPVYRIRSPGKLLDSVETWADHLEKLGDKNTAYWPNFPLEVPFEVSGFHGIVQTSGFLVPGKTYGQLEVYNEETQAGPWNIASDDSKDWSYHWVHWFDVDGDGLLDVMTARFHVNLIGQTQSEFVWLKNPGNLGPEGQGWSSWEQFVLIKEGPDVVFSLHTLTQDGVEYSVMVTGELWAERVMMYYVENKPGSWMDPSNIQAVVIDENVGQIFEAIAIDVNMDGQLEILVSEIQKNVGSLHVYLQPADWRQPVWQKQTLATDFTPYGGFGQNKMTPGKFRTFYPSNEYASLQNEDGSPVKPWISLSGDDDGKHYILYPESEDKNNWTYTKHIIVETDANTAGTMAIFDLDGDGYMEIISAGYSAGTVFVQTFKTIANSILDDF